MSEATVERPVLTGPTALVQSEREALEAWMRWGTRLDPKLLNRAMAKVPVQLSLDQQ